MSQTGFIVRVPQVEARVAGVRERFDASAAPGVPAHITLLFPFMAPDAIDGAVLQGIRDALAGACAFDFVLARAARFPATALLAPEPAAPFIDRTERLARWFPAYPPFGAEFASIVPHLAVAHGDAALAELAHAELTQGLAAHGAIHGRCDAVVLLGNVSGRWRVMHAFPLPTPHGVRS